MKYKAGVVVAALGLFSVGAASANDFMPKPYVGAQYGHTNFHRGGLGHVNQNHITARLGAEFAQIVGLEARLGTGFTSVDKGDVRVKDRYHYGVYGVINLPTEIAVSPYVIGGYSYASTGIDEMTIKNDSASYGLGLNWHVSDVVAVTGEYMRFIDNDWSRQSRASFGVKYTF